MLAKQAASAKPLKLLAARSREATGYDCRCRKTAIALSGSAVAECPVAVMGRDMALLLCDGLRSGRRIIPSPPLHRSQLRLNNLALGSHSR